MTKHPIRDLLTLNRKVKTGLKHVCNGYNEGIGDILSLMIEAIEIMPLLMNVLREVTTTLSDLLDAVISLRYQLESRDAQ